MSERVFALLTVCAAGLFSIAVSVVTAWFTDRREASHKRYEHLRERIEVISRAYEDALAITEDIVNTRNRVNRVDRTSTDLVLARLELRAPHEVAIAFRATCACAVMWAEQAVIENPQGNPPLIVVLLPDVVQKSKGDNLLDTYWNQRTKLLELMRTSILDMERKLQ